MIKGALPVGILGVGEPLIYGVSLPLGRPFITACIGGGIGGAVIGAFHVGTTSIGPSGVALIPLIAQGKWLSYICGLIAAYAGGLIITYFFGVPKSAMGVEDAESTTDDVVNTGTETPIVASVTGDLIQLGEVEDTVFSSKMVGDGFAIRPTATTIVAPADGTIISITKTMHAFTLKTHSGLELLVHLGLDTVELGGKPFSFEVTAGQKVRSGQRLGVMDIKQITDAKKDPTVITVVTNMDAVADITIFMDSRINEGEKVITVTNY